ncbi:structural maintenance of chromosomes protein 6 [Hyalella azteca]|uniref:Structural maintenance of chromosomes protein 6 n=1 Tax=Hyalella azteca TaxID=294128 RepID=A0A8B7P4Q8_HYAAZ|nr:structural maintenance of chromosomes protein 6 [Hyalella azteca]
MPDDIFECRISLQPLTAAAVGRGWCAMPSLAQVCADAGGVKCEVLDAGAASSAPKVPIENIKEVPIENIKEVPIENIKEELLDAMKISIVKEEPSDYDEKTHEPPSSSCGNPLVPPPPLCVPCKREATSEAHEAPHAPQQSSCACNLPSSHAIIPGNIFECRLLLQQLPAAAVGMGCCAIPSLAQVCADAGSVKCEVFDAGAASAAPEVPTVCVKEERDEAMEIISVKEEPFNYDEKACEPPSPSCEDPPVPPCKREVPSEAPEAPTAPQQPSAIARVTRGKQSDLEETINGHESTAKRAKVVKDSVAVAEGSCLTNEISLLPQKLGNCGKIERISLKNFMCHTNLNITFSSGINLIQGKNGSGKSAVLIAVVVGLGGTTNLKDLVQYGRRQAIIEITLSNEGSNAYKFSEFGHSIKIETRIFLKRSVQYKIKDHRGNAKSTNKDHLTCIRDVFGLQVGNPAVILNQDEARSIAIENPSSLYKLFLEASLIRRIWEKYMSLLRDNYISTDIKIVEYRRKEDFEVIFADTCKYHELFIQHCFARSLRHRNIDGIIHIDHTKKLLTINTWKTWSSKVTSTKGKKISIAKMSARDRSFIKVSFLLALWSTTDSPVRMLDEFDVLTELVYRNQSMDTMIKATENTQHIYLTSQDVKMSNDTKISIFRMPDRDRNAPPPDE